MNVSEDEKLSHLMTCIVCSHEKFVPIITTVCFSKASITASTLSLFPPLSAGIPLTPVCTSTTNPKATKQGHVQLSQK